MYLSLSEIPKLNFQIDAKIHSDQLRIISEKSKGQVIPSSLILMNFLLEFLIVSLSLTSSPFQELDEILSMLLEG